MIPYEFAPRKVGRKLQSDGVLGVGVTAAELFIRKRVGRWMFDPLVDRGVVRTLSRQELKKHAQESVDIANNTVESLSPFVSRIKDGYVLTETGLLTTKDFEMIKESAATPEQAQQALMAMSSRELFFGHFPFRSFLTGKPSGEPDVLDTVAPLIPRYPTNYYHWMVETVPKVRYIREYEDKTGTDVTVLIPSGGPPFIEETLDLIDWPKSKIERAAEPMYEIQNLIVPTFPKGTSADFDWIRGEILELTSDNKSEARMSGGENVYVSRSNAIERRVVNEHEVMDVLSDYGFSRYCLENRSLVANVKLFNEADAIVGPHGAGLTNILFCSECCLVELFGEKINQTYKALAETNGFHYEPIYCTPYSADIFVDTEKLEERVSGIIS